MMRKPTNPVYLCICWVMLASPAAWGQLSYTPPSMLLYDSSGNPFPSGSGTALGYTPPAFTCYTIVAGSVVPCTFSGGGGGGTVTSIALIGSANLFSSTAGTAVTTNGTLNVDSQLLAQLANCLVAGPTTGASAIPTCRALVNADFPSALAPTFSAANLTSFPTFNQNTTGAAANLSGTQTANFVYASPNGSTGVGAFRALVAADVPILNQNTTGSAGSATTSTNLSGGAIGSLPYQSAAATTLFVSGNTSTTPQFLTSTGTGSAAQAPVLTGSTGSVNVVLSTSPTLVTPTLGVWSGTTGTNTGAGAASTANLMATGAVFTGGTGTTTFPYWMIQPTAASAVTAWNTAGTFIGVNAASGSAADFLSMHVNGTGSVFTVSSGGNVTIGGGAAFNGAAFIQSSLYASIANNATATFRLASTSLASWSSTTAYSGTLDTGLDRNAAGVVEVNLGTAAGSGGSLKAQKILTSANCASGASPAVCAAASAGAVAMPTGVNPTLVVNTTAVTAGSEILLTVDDSVTIGGTTCNSTLATLVGGMAITARSANTSFTVSYNGTITTNPLCFVYAIIN